MQKTMSLNLEYEGIFMKIEDYIYKGEFGAIIHDENTNQRIFFTWGELREIFDWVYENDEEIIGRL